MNPAGLDAAFIQSSGMQLLGGLYRAEAEGRRPAVLLLHGIPGHEKNLDLAVDLRQIGMHCLYFHYRGAWGSDGSYSLTHLVPDALAAFDWLASHPAVDPKRIAVVGFSLGGWVAFALAASRPAAALAAVAPLADASHVPMPADLARESALTLRGTDALRLTEEWANLPPLTSFAPSLQQLDILLATADADELFPPDHYDSLVRSLPRLRRERFPRADHVFSSVRPSLRHLICGWLNDVLAAGG
jgi:dienelactone hydrolase